MPAAERAYRFEVSEYFFRLTTESVRLFSNAVLKHSTLNEVVQDRSERARGLPADYKALDMLEHLRIIPTSGDIELEISVLETSARAIDDAIPALAHALGTSVQFADALSLLLFDFVVERNKTEVLTKLGLTSEAAKRYRASLKKSPPNVITFKELQSRKKPKG